jgi:hypothetical protein
VIVKLAPVALLALALLVPLCTGTIWGGLLLLLIASGIFFGTVTLGHQAVETKETSALVDKRS